MFEVGRVTSANAPVALRFLSALEIAAKTGDWDDVYPLLAPDVEWIMPKRTLNGLDEVRNNLTWAAPPENFDIGFEVGDLEDIDGDRVAVDVRQVYRMKATGEFAYHRMRRIELALSGDLVHRYEMRIVG